LPSLSHVIVGVGLPMALQWNVVSSPSFTLWLPGLLVKLGGTEDDKTT